MNTIIFDMHGIVFSHSPTNDLNESSLLFDEKIKEYSLKFEKYKTALEDMDQDKNTLALEIEKESVLKGIKGDKTELQVYDMSNAIETLIKYYNDGNKIVIISTSQIETSKSILIFLFDKCGIKLIDEVINSIDIYNIDLFGDKKDSNSWEKILIKYKNIIDIYEDNKDNLEAAGIAAKKLGNKSNLHLKIG